MSNPHYGKLYKLITSAEALSESLKKDIAKDCEVSHETISALSKFRSNYDSVRKLMETLADTHNNQVDGIDTDKKLQ